MNEAYPANCPQCGAPLSANAPAGLCPNCLLALSLKTDTEHPQGGQPLSPLPPEAIAPHFPQLEILECLGRGGMGVVYKARQKTLNRFVALKILAPERVQDPQFAERFAREAQALAALNHPNIVTVYDFGQAGGYYFLLMEFVDGANLRELLATQKFAPEEALAIVPKLCEALQFAHDHGIVHRDIKPENLLLDKSGRVKIADFGIAKMLGAAEMGAAAPPTSGNATDAAIGTPNYMAPEQKDKPKTVDHRADIFSLGVVFYEMLTGELPLGKFAPPSRKVTVDVRLDEVVLRTLEKEPDRRYQKMSEVKTAVEGISGTPGASAGGGAAFAGTPPNVPPPNPDVLIRDILARDYSIGIWHCLSRGWALMCSDFWPVVGYSAIVSLILAGAGSLAGLTGGATFVINLLITGPLFGGLNYYLLKRLRGQPAGIETVFSGFSERYLNLFLGSFITLILTFLGFLFLIVPGIYLFVAWSFTLQLVVDKKMDFWPAMEVSRKVISRHWWVFLGLWIMVGILHLLGALVFCIGGFIATPVTMAAMLYAYEDIFGAANAAKNPLPATTVVVPPPGRPSGVGPTAAVVLAVIGALGMLGLGLLIFLRMRA